MLQARQVEELICAVSAMDRHCLGEQFRTYKANFPVDFTSEFLATEDLERLRHIFLALCLHTQRMPQRPGAGNDFGQAA